MEKRNEIRLVAKSDDTDYYFTYRQISPVPLDPSRLFVLLDKWCDGSTFAGCILLCIDVDVIATQDQDDLDVATGIYYTNDGIIPARGVDIYSMGSFKVN